MTRHNSRRRRHNSRRCPISCEPLEARRVFSTFTVTNLLDSGPGSLRDAIDSANVLAGSDDIEFAPGLKGTVTLASQLNVTDDLAITARGEDKIVLSGNYTTRVLGVSGADTNLTLRQLTIVDGLASVPAGAALGGGLLNEGAGVTLDHVTFGGNRAVGRTAAGGAVANIAGQLDVAHAEFTDNTVQCDDGQDCFGGAIFNDRAARASIAHATFANNAALGGGANGGALAAVDGTQLELAHCVFDTNRAVGAPEQYGAGGAIVVQSTGLSGTSSSPGVTVGYCSFTGNRASIRAAGPGTDARGQGFGGAIIIEFGPTPPNPTPPPPAVLIEHSDFDGNSVEGRSGGTGNVGAAGRLGGPAWGGAIHNVSSSLILRYDRFTNNHAKGGDGGTGGSGGNGGAGNFAIGGAVVSGTLAPITTSPDTVIQSCEFLNNRAVGGNGGDGGANGNGGAAGRGDGGALAVLNGTLTLDDSSVISNTARGGDGGNVGTGGIRGGDGGLTRGGGFAHERGSVTTVRRSLIASNHALGGAGGLNRAGGDALGGGVFNGRPAEQQPNPTFPTNLTLVDCLVVDNLATGGQGGAGGNGGNAFGGGIINANPIPVTATPILTLLNTLVSSNDALGGVAGIGGASGAGAGGGVYNQIGALANIDALTIISGNDASTTDDDVFGTLTVV